MAAIPIPSVEALLGPGGSVSPPGLAWASGEVGLAARSPGVHEDSDSCTVTACASIWRCRLSISCLGTQGAKVGRPVRDKPGCHHFPKMDVERNRLQLDGHLLTHLWHLQGPKEPLYLYVLHVHSSVCLFDDDFYFFILCDSYSQLL